MCTKLFLEDDENKTMRVNKQTKRTYEIQRFLKRQRKCTTVNKTSRSSDLKTFLCFNQFLCMMREKLVKMRECESFNLHFEYLNNIA